MELRHYSEAIDCLDEALAIAEDKLPDLYFRRSQARTYNKFSDNEELEKAMQDIDKAIELKDEPLYKEHKDILLILK
jgi:tetratricopeptide (TPR) repeat protein